ncbi:MAG: hypothetical protein ACXITV_02975 [Luteibaculaceae bacterium]
MKENVVRFIFCLLSIQLAGQGFTSVDIEKKEIDANNKIYRPGLQFVFDIKIKIGENTVFLKLNNDRTYELVEKENGEQVSQVFLTVAKPKDKDRTNKRQTEIFYSYGSTNFVASSTGLVENDKNCWIHPPRDAFFSILELFPFPYIKAGAAQNHRWTDYLFIDERWKNELFGQWDGKLKTALEYEITQLDASIETSFGKIKTKTVESKSKSILGVNYLKAAFSDELGFVRLEYYSDKNISITFELTEVRETKIFKSLGQFIMDERQ